MTVIGLMLSRATPNSNGHPLPYTDFMYFFGNELRIHTWGGLGSQLFAVEAASRLQRKFPRKSIQIVLHSGGVTKRLPEVISLYPEYSFVFVDDFGGEFSLSAISKSKKITRTVVKVLLFKLGFVSNADFNHDFSKIKPWCISLRGHYSYRTIDAAFLEDLYLRLLRNLNQTFLERKELSIHYRLGDLLTLKEKSYVSPERIETACSDLKETFLIGNISIYSDSPAVALDKLEVLNDKGSLSAQSLPVIETIVQCVNSDHFIGTSSKISFWIAGIRSHCFSLSSKLPIENQREYQGLIKNYFEKESTYS